MLSSFNNLAGNSSGPVALFILKFFRSVCIPILSTVMFPISSILFKLIKIFLSPEAESNDAKYVLRMLALVSLSLYVLLFGSFSVAIPVGYFFKRFNNVKNVQCYL